ncbi:DegT/DnrJ/EryC1/StrS family aminotransferase [Streptomyces griseocarneus]|uniref:DegT/DnrJ/EryC1/StrS family aminotransferase n=1 Tax=Streptomyces griseocarneus TaxID=51201 RepID=UPI00167D137E|nr:DegT/DnrJ/EryC1/StrS family aminotransferase [Streptomyces griseocarneus]MBZ6477205.1 DegT/DnrJ/EryC1/StrS family aminotransferase [Streptomyces griseocarneus]GHG54055.1 glutamine--scyllo-inositol aminotransferase [Streptomyces griseocarneus]
MSLDKRLGQRFLPYGANYLDWSDMRELREAIEQGVLFRYQTEGESVASRLERRVAERLGARHVLAVHNGTEALRLALISTRPRTGDLVHMPAVTFVAVAGAVLSSGLIPVLVDVDDSLSLDTTLLPEGTERVIVAHMEGTVAPLPHGVPYVVEDCAQALGAVFPDGRHAGTAGYAGTFSFHHNKVLTSGEGGLVATGDPAAWATMRCYHDHGSARVPGRYPTWNPDAHYGENFVTSEGVAAIQFQQFRHLDEVLAGLERHYAIATDALPDRTDLRVLPRATGDVKTSLRFRWESRELRDAAVASLTGRGIASWTLDKYLLPEHPVFTGRRSLYADGFPWSLAPDHPLLLSRDGFARTRDLLDRTLCVPLSPELCEQDHVLAVKALRQALEAV